jgi:hypothetical protein
MNELLGFLTDNCCSGCNALADATPSRRLRRSETLQASGPNISDTVFKDRAAFEMSAPHFGWLTRTERAVEDYDTKIAVS